MIQKLVFKIGFQIRKVKIENWRDKNIYPLEVLYQSRGNKLLLSIPLNKCRTQLWHTLEADKNPFVKTIVDYQKNNTIDYKSSVMKLYYKRYQPKNAAEVLKINNSEVLKTKSAIEYVLPWDNFTSDEILRKRELVASNENRKAGNAIGLSFGYTDFGPVSIEKGEIEFKRLTKLYEDIRKNGYKEKLYLNDGGIRGYFLIDNKDWCFIITSGKHRAYALSAMGYISIPVILDVGSGVIKRTDDIPYWHQVKSGVFDKEEAAFFAKNVINENRHNKSKP